MIIRKKTAVDISHRCWSEGLENAFKKWTKLTEDTQRKKIQKLLRKVCKEKLTYEELLDYYKQAKKGKDNEYFGKAVYLGKKYSLYKDKEGVFTLFSYYNLREFVGDDGEKIIPWMYPNVITKLFINSELQVHNVAYDIKNLSIIDFWLKYYLHRCELVGKEHSIKRIEYDDKYFTGFLVDGLFEIFLDGVHINFKYTDTIGNPSGGYIADMWWYTPDEILKYLLKDSMLTTGIRFRGYWY